MLSRLISSSLCSDARANDCAGKQYRLEIGDRRQSTCPADLDTECPTNFVVACRAGYL